MNFFSELFYTKSNTLASAILQVPTAEVKCLEELGTQTTFTNFTQSVQIFHGSPQRPIEYYFQLGIGIIMYNNFYYFLQ